MNSWRNFNKKHSEKKAERASSGGNFPPWEMEQLTYESGEQFLLRALPPKSGEPYERAYHWPAGKSPLTCTLEHPAFDGKCVACHAFPNKTDRGRRTLRTVLDVVDFRFFHIVPHPSKPDKETIARCIHDAPNPKVNRCQLCASSVARTKERHPPRHKRWELTGAQWDQVWGVHTKLEASCIHVDESGEVCDAVCFPVVYLCEACEAPHLDEDQVNAMAKKELDIFLAAPHECDCGHTGFLWGVYACENGGRSASPAEQMHLESLTPEERAKVLAAPPDESSTHWAVRGSMFDKVIEVGVIGNMTKIGEKTVEVRSFNFSTGADWSTITEDLQTFGFSDEEIAKTCEPFDFDVIFQPERKIKKDELPSEEAWVNAVLDAQAENLGVANPYASTGSNSAGGKTPWGAKTGLRSFKAT